MELYEKKYIDFLIQKSKEFEDIKPILENYLMDKIGFDELVHKMNDIRDVPSIRSFIKRIKIKKILNK